MGKRDGTAASGVKWCLRGSLGELYLWESPLTAIEVRIPAGVSGVSAFGGVHVQGSGPCGECTAMSCAGMLHCNAMVGLNRDSHPAQDICWPIRIRSITHYVKHVAKYSQYNRNITSFYGSSCANDGKDALNTPVLATSEGFNTRYVTSGALRAWYPAEEGAGREAYVWWNNDKGWGPAHLEGGVTWREGLDPDAGTEARHDSNAVSQGLTQASRVLTQAGRVLTQAGRRLTQVSQVLTQTSRVLTQTSRVSTQ
eukprot:6611739-Pyramimonas_sp.AAC.1